MFRKLGHYTAALSCLLLLAVLYAVTVDRWLQPPQVDSIELPKDAVFRGEDALADLFPASAWQRGSCKRLKVKDGMLLFERLEQASEDGTRWTLKPITVVVGRGLGPSGSPSPIVISSSQGAVIEFDDPLDVMDGGRPPGISGGQIQGEVLIRRVDRALAAEPAAGDEPRQTRHGGAEAEATSLEVRTSNLSISDRKVWTTQPFEMRLGQARLRGEDLTLEFAAAATAPRDAAEAASILHRMELIYLHELTIPVTDDGVLMGRSRGKPPRDVRSPTGDAGTAETGGDAAAASAGEISVDCGGRVQYDFTSHQLRLVDAVRLAYSRPAGLVDRFECDDLTLTLRDPLDSEIRRAGPADWLVEINASGTPAVATLESYDCRFAAAWIGVHVVNGVVEAGGEQGVAIRHGSIHAELDKLNYLFDPNRPRRLGSVYAPGRGTLRLESEEWPVRTARWNGGFRFDPFFEASELSGSEPDPRPGTATFSLSGEIRAALRDGGSFQAEDIEGELAAAVDPPDGGSPLASLQPERIRASGNVRLDAGAIDARTEVLQLFFARDAAGPANAESGDADSSAGSGVRQWVRQPRGDAKPVQPVARPRPVIRGDTIAAELSLAGSNVVAQDLSVRGSVELTHHISMAGKSVPAKMTGARLRLRDGGSQDELQLSGNGESPARLTFGDGFFLGPQIHVLPTANLVEINQPGEFRIPSGILPGGRPSDDPGKSPVAADIRWTQPPHCRWGGSMTFDGQTVLLRGGVQMDASLVSGQEPWDVYLNGESLRVRLLDDVRLRESETLRDAQVQQVTLTHADEKPVHVEAIRKRADGRWEARHVLRAPQLTFMPLGGGKLVGNGPGWYRGWLRGLPGERPGGGEPSAADAADSDDSAALTGVHLSYHDSMVGDLEAQTLDFRRGVRIGVRPVANWEETFDAMKMTTITSGESTVDCDTLRLAADPVGFTGRPESRSPTPWEMIADGGVVFRTRNEQGLVEGTASRASYASAKDLFTVRGASDRPAHVRRFLPSGERHFEAAIASMTIRPRDFKVEDVRPVRVQFGNLPASLRR